MTTLPRLIAGLCWLPALLWAGLLQAQPLPPGSHELSLHHAGHDRRYTVHVPASYRADRPVAVFHLHAKDDDRVLFNGGSGSASDTHADFVSVPATVDKWARLNACRGAVQRVLDKPGVVCEVRSGCAGGAEVRLCVTDSGGHAWPGGRKALGGKGSDALDATAEIWAFFARQ